MLINEETLISLLDSSNNVLLIEPTYKRKYLPLGLAKLSTYLKSRNKKVTYKCNYDFKKYDLILVTSLFTYESEKVDKVLTTTIIQSIK